MIFMLLGQLFAADLASVELERKNDSGLYSRFRSAVSSYALPVAVAAGCATVLWSQLSPHSEDAQSTGWTGGEVTGVSQLACLSVATMTQALAKTTVVQWLAALSCLAIGTQAQQPTLAPDGYPVGNCTYYDEYLAQNSLAYSILGNFPCTGTELDLNGKNIGPIGAFSIAPALQQLTCLTYLNMDGNGLGATGASALASALGYLTSLQHLLINNNTLGDTGIASLAPTLQTLPDLKTLDIGNNAIGVVGASSLSYFLQTMQTFTGFYLFLDNNFLGDDGLTSLSPGLHSCLIYLGLSNNSIGNVGARSLASVFNSFGPLSVCYIPGTGYVYVTSLDLSLNRIGDEGIISLSSSFQNLTGLTNLYVNNNMIGDAGAYSLASAFISNHSTLESVYVDGNNISSIACAALEEAIHEDSPNATVLCSLPPATPAPDPNPAVVEACCMAAGVPAHFGCPAPECGVVGLHYAECYHPGNVRGGCVTTNADCAACP